MEDIFDIVLVGAGMSGSLMASRIHQQHPEWKILLLEKEASPGGRLRATKRDQGLWSYGLDSLSDELFDFLDQSLKADPETRPLDELAPGRRESMGVLAASKISTTKLGESFSSQGARCIAGAAAARDWSLIDELVSKVQEGKKGEQAFANSWSGTRKNASAVALEHLARMYGIPDVWSTTAKDVVGKVNEFNSSLRLGDWEGVCQELLSKGIASEKIELVPECQLAEAHWDDETWSLTTTKGEFSAKRLLVAQNPWDAIQWLDKKYWPSKLVNVPSKAKPVSVVLLTDQILEEAPIPDVTIVPAEGVQIFRKSNSICMQATLNFELTLSAPEVVKAVKRLRRARKKLLAAVPELKVEGDHIALLPVAWSQPLAPNERKVMSKLNGYAFQKKHLLFCGDAYGPNLEGDKNIIASALKASDILA